MFASIRSVALVGVEARQVNVEAHVGGGEKGRLNLVGLPDKAIREAKDRVMAAMAASGYRFPARSVTVNLAPANLPKSGSAYDLPIAIALLAAAREIPVESCQAVALGELALDGKIRTARGGLAAAITASKLGLPCILPPAGAAETAIVPSADIRVVNSLQEAIAAALGEIKNNRPIPPLHPATQALDMADVRGQFLARRALEIAAAGGHHLLMTGPPGVGKTMLARCMPGILPPLDEVSALEAAQVWSAAGLARPSITSPPIRSPHHSATPAAVLGGGSGTPVPGELSLAHCGVLFLDELGEFPPHLLDALRQPLEEGSITIARKGVAAVFPAQVQLVGATNPCPCGYDKDPSRGCKCTDNIKDRYKRRLSGPLLDRFDIRVEVYRVDADAMVGPPNESSHVVAQRVALARKMQDGRGQSNRNLDRRGLDDMGITKDAFNLLAGELRKGKMTGRGFDRVRRVARTIADLSESEMVEEPHAAEALALRGSE